MTDTITPEPLGRRFSKDLALRSSSTMASGHGWIVQVSLNMIVAIFAIRNGAHVRNQLTYDESNLCSILGVQFFNYAAYVSFYCTFTHL